MKRNVYLLLAFYIIFCILEYNDRIDEKYTFADDLSKQKYLESVIVNNSDSDGAISDVINELKKVPDDLLSSYFKNGGEIIITDDMKFEYVAGSFDITSLYQYTIKIAPEYAEYATLHEIGHYLAYIQGINNDRRFKECLKEKEQALNGVLNGNNYFSDDDEYFAEMFKVYCNNGFNNEYPVTESYINYLLSDF